MNSEEAIKLLDLLTDGDAEYSHSEADAILLEWIKSSGGEEVAAAYKEARSRCGFWYA